MKLKELVITADGNLVLADVETVDGYAVGGVLSGGTITMKCELTPEAKSVLLGTTDETQFVSGSTVMSDLRWLLPGLDEVVKCPQPGHPPTCKGEVWKVVVHLNDSCGWTREAVADWLDTLDVDLTFPAEPPTDRPRPPHTDASVSGVKAVGKSISTSTLKNSFADMQITITYLTQSWENLMDAMIEKQLHMSAARGWGKSRCTPGSERGGGYRAAKVIADEVELPTWVHKLHKWSQPKLPPLPEWDKLRAESNELPPEPSSELTFRLPGLEGAGLSFHDPTNYTQLKEKRRAWRDH